MRLTSTEEQPTYDFFLNLWKLHVYMYVSDNPVCIYIIMFIWSLYSSKYN